MTVRVSNRTTFAVRAETYWRDIWLSMPFLQRLYCEVLGFDSVELVTQDGDASQGMKRKLRLQKPIQAAAAVQKVLGSSMTMYEYSEFDPATQRWSYRMVTERLGDRLDASGSITLRAQDGGVEEQSDDEITLRVFGVGSLVEPFIARESKQSHAVRLAFMQRYIEENSLH